MIRIPSSPLRLVDYAFRALGKTQLPLQQLIFFISFDLRKMPPSQARKLIQDLHSQDQITIESELVTLPKELVFEPETKDTPSTNLGELLRQFVSSSRLSRAVGMNDQAVEFERVSQNPLMIKAIVHGSQEYKLILDEAKRRISHNCPDWRRVSVLSRFCKHVAKLVLLLEKEEAIRILRSLQQESWDFKLI